MDCSDLLRLIILNKKGFETFLESRCILIIFIFREQVYINMDLMTIKEEPRGTTYGHDLSNNFFLK